MANQIPLSFFGFNSIVSAMPKRLKTIALFLFAACVFMTAAKLFAQDQDDDSDLDATLQKSFSQFPLLTPMTDSEGRPAFQKLTLTNPVVIDRERIFGFRFKVPRRSHHEDLLWGFVQPGDLKEWYIVPQTGDMDGFTNYYYTSKGEYIGTKPLLPLNASTLILQFLSGDNLKDGQTYLIWLGFGRLNPRVMSLMFTFTNFDATDPHPLLEFERAVGLNELASGPIVNPYNHHTYYLLRPANWERSEQWAKKLGGHLATIRNQAEEDWIFKTFGWYGGTRRLLWIGLNDLDNRFHFSWASGESVSYTDWARNDPDNAGPRGQDYVAIFFPGHGQQNKWKDWNTRSRASPMGLPMDGVVEIIPTNNLEESRSDLAASGDVAVQIKPNMTISSHDGSVQLQWPVSAVGYILEDTTNLGQPFAMFGYSELTNAETGVIYVTITNPSPQMFFRLVKPAN